MSAHQARLVPLILLLLVLTQACTGPGTDGGTDAGAAPDAGAQDAGEADAGSPLVSEEVEPNNGATDDEVGTLAVGEHLRGAISVSGDVDIFAVPTLPTVRYRVHLVTADGELQGHLTVLDSGRDDDAPGGDFVRISRTGFENDVNLEFMAMGAGHLIVVRDARNVDGADSFGPVHTYEVWVEALDGLLPTLTPPETVETSLSHAGAMAVYQFSATEGDEALITFSAVGDLDGRFYVVAEQTGSWIARNDDEALGSPDPRIDAPLYASGTMYLVVDNIEENATNRSFSITMTLTTP